MRPRYTLSALLFALALPLAAQPAWHEMATPTVSSRVRALGGTPDGGLVSFANVSILALVDGRWLPASGSVAGRSYNDATITRSASGAMYLITVPASRHVSTDGGRTWDTATFAVRTASSSALYGGPITDSLMASTDEGATWRGVTRPFAQRTAVIAAHPEVREIIAYDPTSPGLSISTDDGVTWRALSEVGPRAWKARVYPTAMYALVVSGQAELAIHRSTDRGATWSAIGNTGDPFVDIVEDASGRIVRIESERALESTDRGATWTTLDLGTCDGHPARVTVLALDARGRITIGTRESGVYRLEDGQWQQVGDLSLTASPSHVWRHASALYAMRNELGWRSTDAGASWQCVRGTPYAIDGNDVWYRTTFTQLERSTDQGATWSILGEDMNPGSFVEYRSYDPIVLSSGQLIAVYFSNPQKKSGIVRLGENDTMMHTPLRNVVGTADLQVGPTETLYFLLGGRLDRSTDDGATWVALDSTWSIGSITIGLDGTLYGLGTTSAGGPKRLRRSTDEGMTWTDVDFPLQGDPVAIHAHGVTGLAVIHDNVGTRVALSSDRGATFIDITAGIADADWLSFYDTDAALTLIRTATRMYRLETPSGVELEEILGPMNLSMRD